MSKQWATSELSNVANLNMGQSPPSSVCNDCGNGLPFYQGNADFGFKYPVPRNWCSEPKKTADAGDILISVRAPVGALNVALESCCIGRGVAAIKGKTIDQEFLYWALQQSVSQLKRVSQGSTFDAINKDHLSKLNVPTPPRPEQRKISAILTSVDDTITATQRIIDQTEVVKRGLMQQLLTKGIGHTSFKQTEIGEIPTEWDVNVDFIKIRSGFGFKLSEYSEVGVPLIRINNISYGRLLYEDLCFLPEKYMDSYKDIVLRKGDILLALNRPVTQNRLKIARVEASHTPAILYQRVGKLEMDNGIYDPTFYFHYLQSDLFVKRLMETFVGSDQPFIRTSEFAKIPFVVPPIEEQKRIADIFEQHEQLIWVENSKLISLQRLKRGLMEQLLAGKIRVNVDEPSEVSV